MIVYPAVDPQPGFDDLLAGISGEIETHYRGLGRDFYRIRPYEAFESARHVDWKASAHVGSLQVREFAREQEQTVEIFLDRDVPHELDAWFEHAVDCCAFLAWSLSNHGASIHFRSNGLQFRQPEDGDIYAILKYLALVYPQARQRARAAARRNQLQNRLHALAPPRSWMPAGWARGSWADSGCLIVACDTIRETPLIDTIPDILARIVAKKREELAARRSAIDAVGARGRRARCRTPRFPRGAARPNARPSSPKSRKRRPARACSRTISTRRASRARTSAAARRRSRCSPTRAFSRAAWRISKRARAAVSLPVLRKDFTIAASQILEAAAHGADAILLIAAILTEREIRDFREAAPRATDWRRWWKCTTARELDAAIAAGSRPHRRQQSRPHHLRGDARNLAATGASTCRRARCWSARAASTTPADIARLRAAGYSRLPGRRAPDEIGRSRGGAAAAGGGMILKICGITNQEDADAAIDGGATAIGFNFYPRSPRYIAPERAAAIATAPGVRRVGVFVNEPRGARRRDRARRGARRRATARRRDARGVSGGARGVEGRARRARASTSRRTTDCPAEALLLDGPAGELYGGAGKTFDWSLAGGAARRIILAGGLDASNVARAIALAQPWGVDACSRIESAPGQEGPQENERLSTSGQGGAGRHDSAAGPGRALRTLRRALRPRSPDGADRGAGDGLPRSARGPGVSGRTRRTCCTTTPAVPRRSTSPSA